MTTSHIICCGYCVRDNHISFRLFALSNLSVPTLYLKDPRRKVDNSAGSSSDGQVIFLYKTNNSTFYKSLFEHSLMFSSIAMYP